MRLSAGEEAVFPQKGPLKLAGPAGDETIALLVLKQPRAVTGKALQDLEVWTKAGCASTFATFKNRGTRRALVSVRRGPLRLAPAAAPAHQNNGLEQLFEKKDR